MPPEEKKGQEQKGAQDEDKKPKGAAAAEAAEDETKKKPKAEAGDGDAGAAAEEDDEGAKPEGDEGEAEDWRVQWAAGDAKVLEELKRYDNPESVARALVLAKQKAREKGGVTPPKADASAEEKAKFYTEHFGRPEKAEDIKVQLNLPDGVDELPPEVMDTVKSITAAMHRANVFGAEQIQIGAQMVAEEFLAGAKELEGVADAFRDKSDAELKRLWRGDYEANRNLANNYCMMRCEEAGVDSNALANIKLQNGALLGDHPLFMRVMALGGRDNREDPLMNRESDSGSRRADIEAQLNKEMGKRNGTAAEKKFYDSTEGRTLREKLRKDLKRMGGASVKKR